MKNKNTKIFVLTHVDVGAFKIPEAFWSGSWSYMHCELLDMGARNWTQVLCKSSKHMLLTTEQQPLQPGEGNYLSVPGEEKD